MNESTPHYSPDRCWYWNGKEWLPVSPAQIAREAKAREDSRRAATHSSTALWLLLAAVAAAIFLPIAYIVLRLIGA